MFINAVHQSLNYNRRGIGTINDYWRAISGLLKEDSKALVLEFRLTISLIDS